MKVKDLLEILTTLDQEAEVVLSSDAESNSYSPVCDFYPGRFVSTTAWCGDFYVDGDCDPPDNAIPAVVLWPTN